MRKFSKEAEISERLKEALTTKGAKLNDLSNAIGVTPLAISQYISGKTVPRIDKLILIAEYLEVSPLWLMGMDSKSEPKKTPINFDAIQKAYNNLLDVVAYEFDGDVPEDIRRQVILLGMLIHSERTYGWHKKWKILNKPRKGR